MARGDLLDPVCDHKKHEKGFGGGGVAAGGMGEGSANHKTNDLKLKKKKKNEQVNVLTRNVLRIDEESMAVTVADWGKQGDCVVCKG